MKLRWWGQACFELWLNSEIRILTEPHTAQTAALFPEVAADWITLSQEGEPRISHIVRGEPQAASKPEVYPLHSGRILGIASATDNASFRRPFTLFAFEVDGLCVAHAGPMSHFPDELALSALGRVDVLLLPVIGEKDVDVAAFARRVRPSVLIPMTYSAKEPALLPDSLDALGAALQVDLELADSPWIDPRTYMRAGKPLRMVVPQPVRSAFQDPIPRF